MRPSSSTPASVVATEPMPPVSRVPADHDRGDREQFPPHAFGRLAGAELRRQDHPREAGEHARLNVG